MKNLRIWGALMRPMLDGNGFMVDPVLVVVAIATFAGQSVAVVVGTVLSQRALRSSQAAALKAQLAVTEAASEASRAQAAAVNAARALVNAARESDAKLVKIEKTTESTHALVNGRRSKILRHLAGLTRRIANDHPDDISAQEAALAADEAAADADADAAGNVLA